MKLLLNAHNIQKKFYSPIEVSVLNNISLLLHEGESIAIMGASGEGKSTLLQILGTLEAPTNGSIEILGKKVSERSSNSIRNQHIGFVFQGYNLLADYTALQNVLMPALIAGNDISKNSQSYSRALELLSHVGLDDRAHFQTKLLSGGEKQRVAIARALCNDPEILFADEPSGNLDTTTSSTIHSLLLDCAKKYQKGLIIVTHDQDLADLCSTKLTLKQGKLYGDPSNG